MKTLAIALFALVALSLGTGCASNGGTATSGASAGRSSGIEVFGTIDAGVTHTRTQSGK